MIFTTASMLNRWGTPSTTGGVSNNRIKDRRASHKTYNTLFALKNWNAPKGPISKTFNIKNNDSWYISYPDNPSLNFRMTLSNGSFVIGGVHNLEHAEGISGDATGVYFMWSEPNSDVKQTIQSINDANNSITWVISEVIEGYSTIVWTRQ